MPYWQAVFPSKGRQFSTLKSLPQHKDTHFKRAALFLSARRKLSACVLLCHDQEHSVLAGCFPFKGDGVAFHGKGDFGVFLKHFIFVPFCRAVQIEGQSFIFYQVAIIERHHIRLPVVAQPKMQYFALIQNRAYFCEVGNFSPYLSQIQRKNNEACRC